MGRRAKLVPYNGGDYHPNFFVRGPRYIEQAKGICQHCGNPRGGWCITAKGTLDRVVIQAAHVNHDPWNGRAKLIALCKQCHMRYDGPTHGKKSAQTKKLKRRQAEIDDGQLVLFGKHTKRTRVPKDNVS